MHDSPTRRTERSNLDAPLREIITAVRNQDVYRAGSFVWFVFSPMDPLR